MTLQFTEAHAGNNAAQGRDGVVAMFDTPGRPLLYSEGVVKRSLSAPGASDPVFIAGHMTSPCRNSLRMVWRGALIEPDVI